jgi:hypothetical protein
VSLSEVIARHAEFSPPTPVRSLREAREAGAPLRRPRAGMGAILSFRAFVGSRGSRLSGRVLGFVVALPRAELHCAG